MNRMQKDAMRVGIELTERAHQLEAMNVQAERLTLERFVVEMYQRQYTDPASIDELLAAWAEDPLIAPLEKQGREAT